MERGSAILAIVLITVVAIIGIVKIPLFAIAQGILITFIPLIAMAFVSSIFNSNGGSKKTIHLTGDTDKPVKINKLEDR